MKQGRRDFNDRAWSPAGRDNYTRSLERRIQRIERAPVRIDIPTVRPPKKAPRVVGQTAGGAPLLLLAVDSTNAYRRENDGTWTTIAHGSAPDGELQILFNKGDAAFFCAGSEFGISGDNGDTWTIETAPDVYLIDRAPSGRFWGFDNGNQEVVQSDDEGATWPSSSGFIDIATGWSISAHPTDANRVAFGYEDGTTGDAMVEVTTNAGGAWTARTISATTYRVHVTWLPNGRLVALLRDVAGDLHRAYSDDDGATWSAITLLVNAAGATTLHDLRVTENGYVFAMCSLDTSSTSHALLRSADGDAFDVITPHVSTRAKALAFDEAHGGNLYVSYHTDRVFKVPGAESIDAASFVSGSTELTGIPAGVAAVNALQGTLVVL